MTILDWMDDGSMTATDPPRKSDGRRTQAERRAATQGALLAAALDSLVEDGYAGLSTRGVADRARVSQSTMRHYYPTKDELILASMRDVLQRVGAETVERMREGAAGPRRREAMVDLVWEVHLSDGFRALLELFVAAVREPGLAPSIRAIESEVQQALMSAIETLFPEDAGLPDAKAVLETAVAALRGLAVMRPVVEPEEFEVRWQRVRGEIVRMVSVPRGDER